MGAGVEAWPGICSAGVSEGLTVVSSESWPAAGGLERVIKIMLRDLQLYESSSVKEITRVVRLPSSTVTNGH